jgi:transposase-like protein
MLCKSQTIPTPNVMVTDKKVALMKAIKSVFPSATNLLCIWHINKNVQSHGKILGIYQADTDEESSFMKQWQMVISSPTIEGYN